MRVAELLRRLANQRLDDEVVLLIDGKATILDQIDPSIKAEALLLSGKTSRPNEDPEWRKLLRARKRPHKTVKRSKCPLCRR